MVKKINLLLFLSDIQNFRIDKNEIKDTREISEMFLPAGEDDSSL